MVTCYPPSLSERSLSELLGLRNTPKYVDLYPSPLPHAAESQTRREQQGVEMSENVSYGPVKQNIIPSASSGGSTAVPEYEEIQDIHQRRPKQKGIEMSENVSYSPVNQNTIPSSGGSTAVPEYEELSDIPQRGVELKTSAHLETGGSGSKVELGLRNTPKYVDLYPSPLPHAAQSMMTVSAFFLWALLLQVRPLGSLGVVSKSVDCAFS